VRRARPVVLTALAAILAMIPLSHSAFWGPMAITIMGGLFCCNLPDLVVPAGLYALWFRNSLGKPAEANTSILRRNISPKPNPHFACRRGGIIEH